MNHLIILGNGLAEISGGMVVRRKLRLSLAYLTSLGLLLQIRRSIGLSGFQCFFPRLDQDGLGIRFNQVSMRKYDAIEIPRENFL